MEKWYEYTNGNFYVSWSRFLDAWQVHDDEGSMHLVTKDLAKAKQACNDAAEEYL